MRHQAIENRQQWADEPSEAVLPAVRRWTREEYYRMAEVGIIGPDEKLELIDGRIILKPRPMSRAHALGVTLSAQELTFAFSADYFVMQQKPVLLSLYSEPEPDLSVIKGELDDFTDHPTPEHIAMVMEVADTTVAIDTIYKASLYASVGVADFWVLDLNRRVLEVRREPYVEAEAPFGHAYKAFKLYTEEETVSPLAVRNAAIQLCDLLPKSLQKFEQH